MFRVCWIGKRIDDQKRQLELRRRKKYQRTQRKKQVKANPAPAAAPINRGHTTSNRLPRPGRGQGREIGEGFRLPRGQGWIPRMCWLVGCPEQRISR